MSAGDLLNEALGEAIAHRLEEMQTDPAWLKAELTESVITEDLGKGRFETQGASEAGLSTPIDDFGTGFRHSAILSILRLTC
jgi:EAL domain-containing protein (putative c-di-GMP-specific phosphodiesterase class I)